jgi:hypothetical protein
MLEDTVPNPTDQGTQRPNAPLLQEKEDKFIPLKCPDFKAEITLLMNVSPDNSITLFTLYYTPEIIDQIVRHTNNASQTAQDPTRPYTRAKL